MLDVHIPYIFTLGADPENLHGRRLIGWLPIVNGALDVPYAKRTGEGGG